MDTNDDFWNQCYADQKTGWDRGEVHPALIDWLSGGSIQPGPIVVPGCGRGHEVVHLASNGFEVTAIDLASEPIRYLQQQLASRSLEADVRQQSIFDYQPLRPLSLAYEQTCLCAIEPALRKPYESKLYDWLKPGGKLLVLFAQTENAGDHPPFHCDLKEMRTLFSEPRWRWSDTPLKRFDHPSGKLFELGTILERTS
ncbi:MAG: methyltransferase domain-containing protein [Planctomycetota bacterium]